MIGGMIFFLAVLLAFAVFGLCVCGFIIWLSTRLAA